MAGLVHWVKENPLTAVLLGGLLAWIVKESLAEYMPETMQPGTPQAKSARPGTRTILRKPRQMKPGELSGEFKELLEEPPAI